MTPTEAIEAVERALAGNPTPGPWNVWHGAIYQGHEGDEDGDLVILPLVSGKLIEDIKGGHWDDHKNSKLQDLSLIAAANPAALRLILARVRELEASNERMREAGMPMANTLFNLAQQTHNFNDRYCTLFKSMQVKWDAALTPKEST